MTNELVEYFCFVPKFVLGFILIYLTFFSHTPPNSYNHSILVPVVSLINKNPLINNKKPGRNTLGDDAGLNLSFTCLLIRNSYI